MCPKNGHLGKKEQKKKLELELHLAKLRCRSSNTIHTTWSNLRVSVCGFLPIAHIKVSTSSRTPFEVVTFRWPSGHFSINFTWNLSICRKQNESRKFLCLFSMTLIPTYNVELFPFHLYVNTLQPIIISIQTYILPRTPMSPSLKDSNVSSHGDYSLTRSNII